VPVQPLIRINFGGDGGTGRNEKKLVLIGNELVCLMQVLSTSIAILCAITLSPLMQLNLLSGEVEVELATAGAFANRLGSCGEIQGYDMKCGAPTRCLPIPMHAR
jgi:hypothetical protein